MIAAADRAGRLLMVSQNRRYMPELQAFREEVAALGPLSSLTCEFHRNHRDAAAEFLFAFPQPLLLDMAIHLFDAARALTGADPLSVYCDAYSPPWSWYAGPAAAAAVFRMSGDLRFSFVGNWAAPRNETSWTGWWRAIGEGRDRPSGTARRRASRPGALPRDRGRAGRLRRRRPHRRTSRRASATTTQEPGHVPRGGRVGRRSARRSASTDDAARRRARAATARRARGSRAPRRCGRSTGSRAGRRGRRSRSASATGASHSGQASVPVARWPERTRRSSMSCSGRRSNAIGSV